MEMRLWKIITLFYNLLCEAGILLLTSNITETKIWSQLQPEHDVTCSIYSTQPQFENLSKLMQNQGSH